MMNRCILGFLFALVISTLVVADPLVVYVFAPNGPECPNTFEDVSGNGQPGEGFFGPLQNYHPRVECLPFVDESVFPSRYYDNALPFIQTTSGSELKSRYSTQEGFVQAAQVEGGNLTVEFIFRAPTTILSSPTILFELGQGSQSKKPGCPENTSEFGFRVYYNGEINVELMDPLLGCGLGTMIYQFQENREYGLVIGIEVGDSSTGVRISVLDQNVVDQSELIPLFSGSFNPARWNYRSFDMFVGSSPQFDDPSDPQVVTGFHAAFSYLAMHAGILDPSTLKSRYLNYLSQYWKPNPIVASNARQGFVVGQEAIVNVSDFIYYAGNGTLEIRSDNPTSGGTITTVEDGVIGPGSLIDEVKFIPESPEAVGCPVGTIYIRTTCVRSDMSTCSQGVGKIEICFGTDQSIPGQPVASVYPSIHLDPDNPSIVLGSEVQLTIRGQDPDDGNGAHPYGVHSHGSFKISISYPDGTLQCSNPEQTSTRRVLEPATNVHNITGSLTYGEASFCYSTSTSNLNRTLTYVDPTRNVIYTDTLYYSVTDGSGLQSANASISFAIVGPLTACGTFHSRKCYSEFRTHKLAASYIPENEEANANQCTVIPLFAIDEYNRELAYMITATPPNGRLFQFNNNTLGAEIDTSNGPVKVTHTEYGIGKVCVVMNPRFYNSRKVDYSSDSFSIFDTDLLGKRICPEDKPHRSFCNENIQFVAYAQGFEQLLSPLGIKPLVVTVRRSSFKLENDPFAPTLILKGGASNKLVLQQDPLFPSPDHDNFELVLLVEYEPPFSLSLPPGSPVIEEYQLLVVGVGEDCNSKYCKRGLTVEGVPSGLAAFMGNVTVSCNGCQGNQGILNVSLFPATIQDDPILFTTITIQHETTDTNSTLSTIAVSISVVVVGAAAAAVVKCRSPTPVPFKFTYKCITKPISEEVRNASYADSRALSNLAEYAHSKANRIAAAARSFLGDDNANLDKVLSQFSEIYILGIHADLLQDVLLELYEVQEEEELLSINTSNDPNREKEVLHYVESKNLLIIQTPQGEGYTETIYVSLLLAGCNNIEKAGYMHCDHQDYNYFGHFFGLCEDVKQVMESHKTCVVLTTDISKLDGLVDSSFTVSGPKTSNWYIYKIYTRERKGKQEAIIVMKIYPSFWGDLAQHLASYLYSQKNVFAIVLAGMKAGTFDSSRKWTVTSVRTHNLINVDKDAAKIDISLTELERQLLEGKTRHLTLLTPYRLTKKDAELFKQDGLCTVDDEVGYFAQEGLKKGKICRPIVFVSDYVHSADSVVKEVSQSFSSTDTTDNGEDRNAALRQVKFCLANIFNLNESEAKCVSVEFQRSSISS